MCAEKLIYLDCGGYMVSFSPVYGETSRYFGSYAAKECPTGPVHAVRIDRPFMEENRWLVSEDETSEAYLEFQCMMLAAGNHLLSCSRALFHGVSFVWRGQAWIMTAPSGTGKTTQYRHWRRLWRKETLILNGDKPLLECRKDGTVWVHSSPWRGKEGLGSPDLHARLGGIILLKQGDHNHMVRMTPQEAVCPLFTEFVSLPENKDQLVQQAEILDQILEKVPVWKLTNLGDEASAMLTRGMLEKHLEDSHVQQ